MAPIGKLYGFSGNSRFRRALAVATLAGLEVETDPKFTMKDGAWQTPEFLAKFPFGYLPAFEGTDGTLLQESGAIADYCECCLLYTSTAKGNEDNRGCRMRLLFSYPCLNVLKDLCRENFAGGTAYF